MTPSPYTVAALQWNVRRGDPEANLSKAGELLGEASRLGARLALLPEMWSTSFPAPGEEGILAEASRAQGELGRLSRELDLLVGGSAALEEDGRFYNAGFLLDRGRNLGWYRKIHLFRRAGEDRVFSPGEAPFFRETRLGRVGMVICYDLRFPELTRWFYPHKVRVLLAPAQWPLARLDHFHVLTRARALENQCFLLAAGRSGVDTSPVSGKMTRFAGSSRLVSPWGEVMEELGPEEEGVLLGTVDLSLVESAEKELPQREDRVPEVYRKIWKSWEDQP